MRRTEEWARPDWARKVNTAVEKARVERNSCEELIASAEHELQTLMESLATTKHAVAPAR